MVSSYTPDDLKETWPGKFDDWKFSKNGRGEWVGYSKDKKLHGIIISKTDDNGQVFPYFEKRELDKMYPMAGGLLVYFAEKVDKLFGSKKSAV